MNEADGLNAGTKQERLSAIRKAARKIQAGEITTRTTEEVNNHIHTIYSFSPYSPTMAVYLTWEAGLQAVGIMDHDSVAGAEELLEACAVIGLGSTAGFEVRVNFTGTALEGRKINSPDSNNIGYIAVHGIPRKRLPDASAFLEPVQRERNRRNRKMVERVNSLIRPIGLEPLDFEKDVYALSMAREGGSITERHILYALGKKIVDRTGRGAPLISFLQDKLNVTVPEKIAGYLQDEKNPHYVYDLLGLMKISFIEEIFLQPDERECISVREAVDFANRIGAIPAYAYLGDITESPTGDKKAEKFEDDFLDELFDEIKALGFKAVTYMPPRNTREQLKRIQNYCGRYGFMEISGVDINSSRQSFSCPIILESDFYHLVDATWALIAHEKLADCDEKMALFHPANPYRSLSLEERIAHYSRIGRRIDRFHPEDAMKEVRDGFE
jgi:predicted metal-dependent phosphoesterase TrpH